MKLLIVYHSYVAEENRKNLTAFKDKVSIMAVVPDWVDDPVLGRLSVSSEGIVKVFRRICLPRTQYLLASWDLGMSNFKPDLVHLEYDPWSPIYWQTWFVKYIFAPKAVLVCTVKKNTFRVLPKLLQSLKDVVTKYFVVRTDHFFAVNLGVRQIYSQRFNVGSEQITVQQHLGIDTCLFKPSSEVANENNGLRIGYCGRIDSHKGIMNLIEAVESLQSSSFNLTLSLLGDGQLKKKIESRNLDWLEILPAVPHDQVAAFMQTLDIFVLPALVTVDHEEHDGHALMEAMACGVACIGTRSGVIPEILGAQAGLVVDPEDSAAIANAIKSIASNTIFRNELGEVARRRVCLKYSLTAIANRKLDVYKRLTDEI